MATAVKPVVTPKFGGGGEKCKTCNKTVYPLERISYDNGTWHQLCFKCLSCNSTLSLTAVAMIGGDLYCKTCFTKIFLREGKYTSFDQAKTLPKDFKHGQQDAVSPPPALSPSPEPVTPKSPLTDQNTSPPSRSPATSVSSLPATPLSSLQLAVEKKDAAAAAAILDEHGAALLFAHVKPGQTVLEWSLSSYLHKAQGARLVEWLEGRVKDADRLLAHSGVVSPLRGKKQAVEEEAPAADKSKAAHHGSADKVEEKEAEAETTP